MTKLQMGKKEVSAIISLTNALTVVFLVKPPKLPDSNDIISGKLAAYAPDI